MLDRKILLIVLATLATVNARRLPILPFQVPLSDSNSELLNRIY